MACDECDKCKSLGYKFCIKCGENFADTAEVPKHVVDNGSPFGEMTLRKSVIPAMFVILVAIVADLIVLLINFEPTFQFVESYKSNLFIYIVDVINIVDLTGSWLQIFWVFIAVMLIISIGMVLYRSKEVLSISQNDYVNRVRETPVYWLGLTLGAALILQLMLTLVFNAFGISTPVPEGLSDLTVEEATFLFGEAAVNEELVFRVFWLGLPMAIVALAKGRKDFLKNLWGGFGASKVSVLFLFISSIIFAYAHVSGWGLWKMLPVMIGGFCMGYLYMKFGLHASIVFHMIVDFTGVWTEAGAFIGSIITLFILFTGLICIPILLKRTWEGLKSIGDLPMTGYEPDQDDSIDDNID